MQCNVFQQIYKQTDIKTDGQTNGSPKNVCRPRGITNKQHILLANVTCRLAPFLGFLIVLLGLLFVLDLGLIYHAVYLPEVHHRPIASKVSYMLKLSSIATIAVVTLKSPKLRV